jgi:hypothetical protein
VVALNSCFKFHTGFWCLHGVGLCQVLLTVFEPTRSVLVQLQLLRACVADQVGTIAICTATLLAPETKPDTLRAAT